MTTSGMEIPDGYYATVDPNKPDVTTLWQAVDGELYPSPAGAKWGPVLYRRDLPKGLSAAGRRDWIGNWFATNRRPWEAKIRTAIVSDPEYAGRLYASRAIRCRDCGRPLKDPTSKAAGRGPDCRSQLAQLVTTTTDTAKEN